MIIYLELLLPAASSDPPENRPGKPIVLCLVLLRMGFTCAPLVTLRAVVSYTAFPPLPGKPGGLFLLHWPWSHLHRTLSGILPCEARTFLTCMFIQPRSFTLLTMIDLMHELFHCYATHTILLYMKRTSANKFP